jgi:hypothetical protein
MAEAESQQVDEAVLEELKARKVALDTERTQLEQELLDIIHRGRSTRMKKAIKRVDADLKAYAEKLTVHLDKRHAFEKDWYKCHPWLKESPKLDKLAERRVILDLERTAFLAKYSKIIGAIRPQAGGKRTIRYYKRDLREIEDQFLLFRKNREAFEKDWEAFCDLK